jgi:hypothetical protein
MILSVKHKINFITVILPIVISMILFCTGCHQHSQSVSQACRSIAPANGPTSSCIDVEGKVLGGINPCSKVYLYKTSSLNYDVVMAEIKDNQSVMQECVNATKDFRFNCLYPGKYAFVIPTTSYNGSVGAPLPYEFDCENVSIRIAFQGGDSTYMVGAFTIEKPRAVNHTLCKKRPWLCIKNRGSLYIECPLDLGIRNLLP